MQGLVDMVHLTSGGSVYAKCIQKARSCMETTKACVVLQSGAWQYIRMQNKRMWQCFQAVQTKESQMHSIHKFQKVYSSIFSAF